MTSLVFYLYTISLCQITFTSQQEPTLSFFGDNLSLKRSISDIPIISDDNDQSNRKLLSNNNAYPITITISPSQLTTPNFGFETIQISWHNATMQTWDDWIGIYSPPNASDIDYLDFFDPFPSVNGMIEKRIFNLRDNYQCRYFIKNYITNTFVLKGISNIATVIPNQPLQGHLSLTKNSPNEMQIRWVSSLISNPMVKIGTISKNYTNTFLATYYTYDTTKMCCCAASIISAKQFRHPGYIYTAIINNLETDREYFYIFGNNEYWSNEESFITESKDNTKTFGFIMYGDQGTGDEAFKLTDLINTEIDNDRNIKLLLHIGDLSYAWGNGYNWDKWCNMISKVAMKVPYMISIGNHEYCHLSSPNDGGNDVSGVSGNGYHPLWGNFHNDSNGECGVPSYYRFDADINENGNSIFWYSFNYQSAHFIILSSEHNYSIGTNGYKFLLNDLRNINNTITPWIIVSIHRPLYQSEIYRDDNIVDAHLVQLLEPIFYMYNVDIVLAGHFHSYERTCSVYNYTCLNHFNGGIVHLTCGAAGYLLDNAQYIPNEYILYRNEIDFGYGKFFVHYTHFSFQYITIDDNNVIDELTLMTRNKPKQFVRFEFICIELKGDLNGMYKYNGEYNHYPYYIKVDNNGLYLKFDNKWNIYSKLYDSNSYYLQCNDIKQQMDITKCNQWKDYNNNLINNINIYECYPKSTTTKIIETDEIISPQTTEMEDDDQNHINCVITDDCMCINNNNYDSYVCCNGIEYISQCIADCKCKNNCLKKKCDEVEDNKTMKIIVICGIFTIVLVVILFVYRWYDKYKKMKRLEYELAILDDDESHEETDEKRKIKTNEKTMVKTNLLNNQIESPADDEL